MNPTPPAGAPPPRPGAARRTAWWAFAFILLGVLLLYATAPKGGAFYWSDAPRHALNGVFLKDLVAAFPWRDPVGFAHAYYAQYPALTLLFYPPLFYVLSAPFFALLGVSHEVALGVVMLHYLALGWGVFRLARMWLDAASATALALALMFLPEVAFWGRQVMLEVPSFAFVAWSAVWLVRHLRSGRTGALAAAVALLVLALYTKISVAFLVPVFAMALLRQRGLAVLREPRLWGLLLAAAVALVPLMVLTLKFGQANVQSVTGVADRVASRATLEGWLWYASQFPLQMGWPVLVASLGLMLLGLRGLVGRVKAARLPAGHTPVAPSEAWLLLGWLVLGYLFFSAIDLKEPRHSVYLLLPWLLGAVLLARRALGLRLLQGACVLLALLAAGWTLTQRPTFYVQGYAQVADYVGRHAPPGTAVLFSGYRDGAFTFNIRALKERPDLTVVRADKILLRVAVRRELGVEQKTLDDAELLRLLDDQAIHYLVVQPGFWSDLAAMRQLERLLATQPQFQRVLAVPTPANFPAHEKELVIYRNLNAKARMDGARVIDLPIVGGQVTVPPQAADEAPAAAPAGGSSPGPGQAR